MFLVFNCLDINNRYTCEEITDQHLNPFPEKIENNMPLAISL